MKICLINFYSRQYEYPSKYSLAVLRLSEYLKSYNYKVDIIPIDLNNYKNYDVDKIIEQKYDLIGFSTYSWVLDATNYINNELKSKNPNLNIVLGGPEVDVININDYDNEYFIIGEGELALKELCDYIYGGKKDLTFFLRNPNIYNKQNPKHEKVETKIQIVNPLFTNTKIDDKDFLWYETCRGCAFTCGYCGHKTRHNVEYIDTEIIKQEIININKMGFKKIFVTDPNFAGTKNRAKLILSYFNKYAPNVSLGMYFRPEFIDDEMINILRNTNINEIRIGIQTTNSNVPKWIRSNDIDKVINELPKLSQNDINWRGELITGLPGDNLVGLKESMKFIETLNPTEYYSYHLTVIPNTPLYNLKDNFDNPLWVRVDKNNQVYDSSSYSHEELLEMLSYAKEKTESYNVQKVKKIIR